MHDLIGLYEAMGKPDEAERRRAKLRQIEAVEEWQDASKMTFFTS